MRLAPLLLCLAMLAGCQTAAKHEEADRQAKSAELHFRLGIDALSKNNMPKAFAELLHAEKLAPGRADILDALGIAWIKRGQPDKAEAYYRRAIHMSPPPSTYNNYGGLLLTMGKYKQAEAMFRRALDDPRYRHPDLAYINLGDALLAQNRFDEAIASYRQARQLNPIQQVSRLKEAQAYAKHGKTRYAKAMYEAILREHPTNRAAMQELLALLRKSGDRHEARDRLMVFSRHATRPEDIAWAQDEMGKLDQQ